MEEELRLDIMRRVADLYEAFKRHEISWPDWNEQTAPLLRALHPDLHCAAPLATAEKPVYEDEPARAAEIELAAV